MTKFCCRPCAAENRLHINNIVNCNCAVWDNEVPLQHTRGGGSIPLKIVLRTRGMTMLLTLVCYDETVYCITNQLIIKTESSNKMYVFALHLLLTKLN